MEKKKSTIWNLVTAIIIFAIGCLAGFSTSIFSFLIYILVYILNFILFFVFLVIFILSLKKDKKQIIINGLCVVISFITVFYSYGIYELIHNYSLTNKYLKEKFSSSYHIKGLSDKEKPFTSYYNCKHIFEVYLDDSIDIVFEAGYCSSSRSIFPERDVVTNYGDYYIQYYYEEYKKNGSATFKIEKKEDGLVITYNDSNVMEVYDFMEYIKDKLVYDHITVEFHNESTNRSEYYNFWNKFDYLL